MRKLVLQIQMSIDGFIAGPNGEMEWVICDWDKELNAYVEDILKSVDCIVLGRKLAEGFIPYWEQVASDPEHVEQESGKQFTYTPRVVFSKTLKTSPWKNATIVNGDLAYEMKEMKKQDGNDIYACGGANFVSNLIKDNLIDELHLFINPSVLGNGMPIFAEVESVHNYRLEKATTFECGIVVLKYYPVLSE